MRKKKDDLTDEQKQTLSILKKRIQFKKKLTLKQIFEEFNKIFPENTLTIRQIAYRIKNSILEVRD
jgi:hypothetical protein